MGDSCRNSKDFPTSIMDLPKDCIHVIFQKLESSYDRDSFGLTCHNWLRIQNSSRRSLHFYCSFTKPCLNSGPNINTLHLYSLLTRFQQLSLLSLSGCTELQDSGLRQVQIFGSNLKALSLDCCYDITDNGLSLVSTGCPLLASISLRRCTNVTDFGLDTLAKSCSALQEVNLSYCSLISDRGIRSLSRECLQLRAVTISYCKIISGVGFSGCSQKLTYLEAEFCKFEPEGIFEIVSGKGLEYLNVSCLSWCILGDGLAGIGVSGFATRLQVLNLRSCRGAGNEAVMAIAKGCPALREWSLALCSEVRLPGWVAIGLNCHNLEILHVNRCRNLCDNGLQALRDGCKRLKVLYMGRLPRVTQLAVELFKLLRGDMEIRGDELMCIFPYKVHQGHTSSLP